MQTKHEKYLSEKERQERLEHQDVLLAIAAVIETKEGKKIFEYLFKNLEVGTLPPINLRGEELHEMLGFLRAGNSIYKLVCEAATESAASILSSLERKRYEELIYQHRIESDNSDE